MWETPFEESMLVTHRNLIIHCPHESLAGDLMEVLERNGVMWHGNEKPTSNTNWDENGEDTCYWVESGGLSYSEKQYADEDPDGEYSEHIRCTFCGIEYPDFEVADDNELLTLLGVGGG